MLLLLLAANLAGKCLSIAHWSPYHVQLGPCRPGKELSDYRTASNHDFLAPVAIKPNSLYHTRNTATNKPTSCCTGAAKRRHQWTDSEGQGWTSLSWASVHKSVKKVPGSSRFAVGVVWRSEGSKLDFIHSDCFRDQLVDDINQATSIGSGSKSYVVPPSILRRNKVGQSRAAEISFKVAPISLLMVKYAARISYLRRFKPREQQLAVESCGTSRQNTSLVRKVQSWTFQLARQAWVARTNPHQRKTKILWRRVDGGKLHDTDEALDTSRAPEQDNLNTN
jgi:hypothetical protein